MKKETQPLSKPKQLMYFVLGMVITAPIAFYAFTNSDVLFGIDKKDFAVTTAIILFSLLGLMQLIKLFKKKTK